MLGPGMTYGAAVPPAVTCAIAVAFGVAVDIARSTGTEFTFLRQVPDGWRCQSYGQADEGCKDKGFEIHCS